MLKRPGKRLLDVFSDVMTFPAFLSHLELQVAAKTSRTLPLKTNATRSFVNRVRDLRKAGQKLMELTVDVSSQGSVCFHSKKADFIP